MHKVRENIASILLTFVLGSFVAYGIFHDPNSKVRAQASALERGCERAKGRAVIFQNFTNEASSARRRSAEKLQGEGDTVGAANELATAKRYEQFGKQWISLTPQDCGKEFPQP